MHEKINSAVAYFFAWGLAAIGAASLQDWATIIGILFAIATFINNWHHKKKCYELLKRKPSMNAVYDDIKS